MKLWKKGRDALVCVIQHIQDNILYCILCSIGHGTIYRPHPKVVDWFVRRYPKVLFKVSTHAKKIALTIDDAPCDRTWQILDALKDHQAKATFFVIGSQMQSPGMGPLVRRMFEDGHEVGNHFWVDALVYGYAQSRFTDELIGTHNVIYAECPPERLPTRKFLRTGGGFFHKRMFSWMEDVKCQHPDMAYNMVLGDIYPHDPQVPKTNVNIKYVLDMAHPGGIMILHARRGQRSVNQIVGVLEGLGRMGYEVVSVGELLDMAAHNERLDISGRHTL